MLKPTWPFEHKVEHQADSSIAIARNLHDKRAKPLHALAPHYSSDKRLTLKLK